MSWKAVDDDVQYLQLTDGGEYGHGDHEQHGQSIMKSMEQGTPFPIEIVARIRFELVGWGSNQSCEHPEVNTHRVRLSAFIERYITDYLQLKARKSLRQETNRLKNVQRLLKSDPYIDEITTSEIEHMLVSIVHSGRSTATYNRYRARLHSLFRKAIDWGYRSDNPVKCVERLRESPIGDRYLTFDEFHELLKACDSELRPFVHLAAVTGIRQGALLEVRWEDIEPDLTFITVRAETTKTGEPRRVPLNQEARKVLGEIGPCPSGRVFTFERFPRSKWNSVREKLAWKPMLAQ